MSNADWAGKDFYKVLGVSKDADAAAIKKAYRKLARDHHPDSKPGDKAAEEKFKAIAEAYHVLGDPERRKEYDQVRSMFGGGFPGGAGGFPGGGQTFDLNDFLRQQGGAGGGLGDLFGDLFTGSRGQRARRTPRRGADVETTATLSFRDAVQGTTISLRLTSEAPCHACSGTGGKPGTQPRICPTCEGTGMTTASVGGAFSMNETCRRCGGRQLVYDEPCPVCHGSGRGLDARTVTARIPAGVKNGQRIRLKGKGGAGEQGGPPGDLFVVCKVTPHPVFGRKGDNLTVTVPVTFDEAALGATVKVPTLTGAPVAVRVPPGTPSGRTLRVRGKGAPKRDGTPGDLLVTIEVVVPPALSEPAREAVESYRAATSGTDPRSELFAKAGL